MEYQAKSTQELASQPTKNWRPVSMSITEALDVMKERAGYLQGRIEAKKQVKWDTKWDERERQALITVIAWFTAVEQPAQPTTE